MKTHRHPKLKTPTRPLFSCGFFGQCTQNVLSPTTPHPPSLTPIQSSPPPSDPPPPPPPSDPPPQNHDSSSTSSSSTSQSFTQWRFPLSNSPLLNHRNTQPRLETESNLRDLFETSEVQLQSGSDTDKIAVLHLLERSLVPNPQPEPVCPPELMRGVVRCLRFEGGAKLATKILLALCLAEGNRRVAVEVRAAGEVVEAVMEMESAAAERALAALELMCTVEEGAAEVRSHALSVPVMVEMMGRLEGCRGKEYAISVLAVVFGGENGGGEVNAPPEEVARAVELALKGECSARGRRKGMQLLKVLKENERSDLPEEG